MNTDLAKTLIANTAARRIAVNATLSPKSARYIDDIVETLKMRGISATRSSAIDTILLWASGQLPPKALADQPELPPLTHGRQIA